MKALIIVDLQNDFMPGGALAVPHADELPAQINSLIPHYNHVIATLDWHPKGHVSFSIWPEHCVQGSRGAALVSALDKKKIEKKIYKGQDPTIDSYSAFFDNDRKKETGLAKYLRAHGLNDLDFVGVATEYCVLYSVLDALSLGFKASIIRSGCRAIDPIAGDAALRKMGSHGAAIL